MQQVLNVRIKKVHPEAKIPEYAKFGDAGQDITAVDMSIDGDIVTYDTGLQFEVPEGYVGLLYPRSSIYKTGLVLCNSTGVLDSSFRGTVKFKFRRVSKDSSIYITGDRIGQIMIVPYPLIKYTESDKLSETERAEGGFGHTGT